ncbi:putative tyrosine recombinase [Lyophyllum shimeji]|uniref:Tyrosine recombinase n=1 Tax=Lyophyllum shimeji TaxID=47721 RepID=A0A9P3UQ41_LYOSH|nr:putative tyrosine recombinase [Lyophyllum shimeji]
MASRCRRPSIHSRCFRHPLPSALLGRQRLRARTPLLTQGERTPLPIPLPEIVTANQNIAIVRALPPDARQPPRVTRPRFLVQAQARRAHQPVRYASGVTGTTSASVSPTLSGTGPLHDAGGTSAVASSTRRASSYARTGNDHRGAAAPAPTTSTSAPDAEGRLTELKRALERRRIEALSPYKAEAWERLLRVHNLLTRYPNLPSGFRNGFDAGIPLIERTHTPDNGPSLYTYSHAYLEIVEKEFNSQRYIGPLSKAEVESVIGPFQTSPLSLVPKPGRPNKFRAVHNFSFPRASSAGFHSVNYCIDSNLFPCTWGTFATICTTIWNLPPDSQASIRDVAEAYRTIPIKPDQWPGLVVRLRDDDSFAINTNNNFGLTSAGGVYGSVGDGGADIFRAEGMGPLSKWVDDHIFFRILRVHLDDYNKRRSEWCRAIAANGGRLQDRSRFWYRGETMPSGLPMEFDEDASFPIRDLSTNSPRSPLDAAYTYSSADIDALSHTLGIPWEASKTVEFGFSVQYLGLVWDLQERTVSVPQAKKEKYLQAISEWYTRTTHTLEDVRKLYGKLLHTSLIIPAGRAYLTRLETMLANFRGCIFTPHHPPAGTDADLKWWIDTLTHPSLSRRIPGPRILIDHQAYSDASSGIGIGITIGNRWRAWRLIPGWHGDGRDIGWAEAVGFEFLVRTLLTVSREGDEFKVFGDNRGVVEGWWKGRSRNKPTNTVFKRIHGLLSEYGCNIHTRYVPSEYNPADDPSRGKYYARSLLLPAIPIPLDLSPFILDFDSPLHAHEIDDRKCGHSPTPLPKSTHESPTLEERRTRERQIELWGEAFFHDSTDW